MNLFCSNIETLVRIIFINNSFYFALPSEVDFFSSVMMAWAWRKPLNEQNKKAMEKGRNGVVGELGRIKKGNTKDLKKIRKSLVMYIGSISQG